MPVTIEVPVTYQGGKQRLSKQIVDIIQPSIDQPFTDFCCGSGAISIELVNRGFPVEQITMLDSGPWGLFWQQVGEGTFDLALLETLCKRLSDPRAIQAIIKEMAQQPVHLDTAAPVFLLLQAASFGGKAIWIRENRWQNCSFRSYWEPTPTSNRRSHVNPMMPMPETLLARTAQVCAQMRGVKGQWKFVGQVGDTEGTRYIDPPYQGTTRYGDSFDLLDWCSRHAPIWVSEGYPVGNRAFNLGSFKKGGISGARTKAHEEWLSLYE